MALIKCPECKKKVSDQCEKCPHCGYPLKSISQIENSENQDATAVALTQKPFYKRLWLWIIVGIVLVGLALSTLLFLNHDTKPKLDENGNPVFVELTNEVYTNAKKYKGYYINIKGKVFQVMSDNGNVKGIQIWIDPDTCEQNLMIYYTNNAEVKQGDYIVCSGYIDSVTEYKNAYGAKLYAPLVISSDLKESTYLEVMAPTIESILPENIKQEKYGYSFSIDKIEFAENETRVIATVANKGKETLYIGDAVIIQEGKQYNSKSNYEANYEELPYELIKDASGSGIIVFPALKATSFDFIIDIHSDNSDEKLGELKISISKEETEIKTPWPTDPKPTTTQTKPKTTKPSYASIVGTYQGTEVNMGNVTATFYSNGTLSVITSSENFTGTWTQNKNYAYFTLIDPTGFEWTPQEVTVSNNGIDGLWGEFYQRIN